MGVFENADSRKIAIFCRTHNLGDLVASLSHFLGENDGKPVDLGVRDKLLSDRPI